MGKDYYSILGVARTATEDEIKKAYKKKAFKVHPDRNMDKKAWAEEQFKALSEAYEVLVDKEKRAIYDQYGEEGLKGMPPPGSAEGFEGGPGVRFTSNFHPSDASKIFEEFMRGFSFGGAGAGGRGATPFGFGEEDDDPMGGFGFQSGGPRRSAGGNPFFNMGGMGGGMGGGPRKDPPIHKKLNCTLEELYTGKTKKLKVTRRLYDPSGQFVNAEKVLEVPIKPGCKAGTKYTFRNEGDEHPGKEAADMVFEIAEVPHPVFTREGNNLVHTATISLKEALTGTHVMLNTLPEGRPLKVNVRDVVKPGFEKVVAGRGMPLPKDPTQRGDLIIRFNVVWPSSLSADQKESLANILN